MAFVYQNSRAALATDVAAGRAPDTTLLGQNHLAGLGIDALVHDPVLTRRGLPRRFARVAWNARELLAPWELWRVDAVFTPLATFFPLAAVPRRLPTVVVNYGLSLTYRRSTAARRRLLAASLRAASAVVCLGESQSRLLASQTGVVPRTVHLGVDERFWSPRPRPEAAEPYVLAVGKDLARDYATLADALRGLDAPARLVAHPRNLAGVRLPANVTAVSSVPWDELRELYAGAGCVVLAQRREDYPYGSESGGLTALLEAWACGRPVVATDRAIVRDYSTERTAVLVPAEDASALRAAIEAVLGDPGRAAALGVAARAQVEREHTTRRFAERLAPILRAAAAPRAK